MALASRFARVSGTSVFTKMSGLATRHKAVNLGQGFPSGFDAPLFLRQALADAVLDSTSSGVNQYCRSAGAPELTRAVADHQNRFYNLSYDPMDEVTIFSGATEAIYVAINALTQKGDGVVVFEPFYDSYVPCTAASEAHEIVVPLTPKDFSLDFAALELALKAHPEAKLLILNSPHNPTGKCATRAELERLAGLCVAHDLIAVTDEVYEHLTYDNKERLSLAQIPSMKNRCVQISSAGKTFSCTGWKVGTACASKELTEALRAVHQFTTFSTSTPFQHALVHAYRAPDAYFQELQSVFRARRDLLCRGLERVGLEPIGTPEGGYFAVCSLKNKTAETDVEFCERLVRDVGVAAIPCSAFYSASPAKRTDLVRFAFCKHETIIEEGMRLMSDAAKTRKLFR